MRLAGHLACMKGMRNAYNILIGKPKRDHSEDIGIDGKIILEWILGKEGGKVWTGYMRPKIGTSGRLL
jgi:hypothetical protein